MQEEIKKHKSYSPFCLMLCSASSDINFFLLNNGRVKWVNPGGKGVAIYSKYLYGNGNQTQEMNPSNWQDNCIQKIQSTYFS